MNERKDEGNDEVGRREERGRKKKGGEERQTKENKA